MDEMNETKIKRVIADLESQCYMQPFTMAESSVAFLQELLARELRNQAPNSPAIYHEPQIFRAARYTLGLSANGLAEVLGLATGRNVRKYEAGESDVSGPAARLMWMFMQHGVPDVFKRKKSDQS